MTDEQMFSKAEIALLYEKAIAHFCTPDCTMMPIPVLTRNKPREYYDEIRRLASENGGDEIMQRLNAAVFY